MRMFNLKILFYDDIMIIFKNITMLWSQRDISNIMKKEKPRKSPREPLISSPKFPVV